MSAPHGSEFFDDDLRPRDTSHEVIGGDHFSFRDDEDIEPDVHPLTLPSSSWTLLPAVERCDNATLPRGPFDATSFRRRSGDQQRSRASHSLPAESVQDEELLIPFFVEEADERPIGFLRPKVVEALQADNEHAQSKLKMQPCWKILRIADSERDETRPSGRDIENREASPQNGIWGVAFAEWLNEEGKDARSEHMDRLCRSWKAQGLFNDELKGELNNCSICNTCRNWSRLAQRALPDLWPETTAE